MVKVIHFGTNSSYTTAYWLSLVTFALASRTHRLCTIHTLQTQNWSMA